jgi:2',3'-cyclic-nucleotide 2'-phosphodiesterase
MNTESNIKLLFLGDIIGKPGRQVVKSFLGRNPDIADIVIANVENSAHGFGTTQTNLQELKDAGVKVFSGGNHTFDRKEVFEFIDKEPHFLRPANYPEGTPGKGYCLIDAGNGLSIAVINLMGRVYMEPLMSPFLVADQLIDKIRETTNLIFVDFHAEATAEKVALGWYLDGRVSAVVGTHTHVQTADERILPGGTAYLTDAGCCGPRDGVIGMDKESVFRRMVNQLPARFDVASGPALLCGVRLTLDPKSGKATEIERVQYMDAPEHSENDSRLRQVTAQV